jgi:hypothetical protein
MLSKELTTSAKDFFPSYGQVGSSRGNPDRRVDRVLAWEDRTAAESLRSPAYPPVGNIEGHKEG